MEQLRVGIAGLGIGAAVHLPVFASMPGVRVEGVASSRPEKAAATADKYGVPHSFGDVSGLLELELDAIVLALPPKINGLAAGSALKRGIAVLAEKPLAGDADSARILADLARGHTAMVNFQFAELRTFAELGRQLEAGAIGTLRYVHISWLSESWSHRRGQWSWKLDAGHHGGVMSMLGAHIFYLIEQLFGKIACIEAVYFDAAARALAPSGASPAEDTALVRMEIENGLPVTVTVSNAARGASVHRWEVVGSGATLELENTANDPVAGFTLTRRERSGERTTLASEVPTPGEDSRYQPVRNIARRFVDAALHHAEASPDFSAGARVQRLLEATLEASRASRMVVP